MRLRLRFLVLLIVVTVWLARGSWLETWQQMAERLDNGQAREPVTLSHTYLLHETSWLEFHLPPAGELTWVLTNANFPRSAVSSDTPESLAGAVYAMQYEFLGAHDEVLQADTYHFRALPPNAQEAAHPRAFYSAQGLLPGTSQSMRQRLAGLEPRPTRLRLRLGDRDDRIREVAVRVYCQDELPEYKLTNAWRRTTRSKREKLCRASVYGPELLTDYERRNLMKWKWLPLAPAGVEGRDYARRILYSLISDEMEPEITELPAGLPVDNLTCGVIPLPDGPGSVRLELAKVTAENSVRSSEIDIRWSGRQVEQQDHWHLPDVSSSQVWEAELDGGLLEVVATKEVVVRAFWRSATAAETAEFEEITPEPNAVRAYVVGPQSPVEYAIEHVQGQATPFKLALRQLLPPATTTSDDGSREPATVDWTLIGSVGQIVRQGRFDTQEAPSHYDRLSGATLPGRVTEPAVQMFAIPPGVRSVRLESAAAGIVVSAYSQPPDVTRVTFVPQDYSAFHRQQGWRQSWFLLRPVDHLQRVNSLSTVTILTQSRPREVEEQRLAGEYQWESFQPSGSWKGRHLMLPRETRLPSRWESQGSAFYELQTGIENDLSLLGEPGHRWVAPRLVCEQAGVAPVNLRVYANGQLHQELRLLGRLAEFELAPLPAGQDETTRLRIETDREIRVLMNRIERDAATVLFKRMVIRIEGRTLNFDYEKQSLDEEMLALTLFHAGTQQHARLRVRILGDVVRAPGPSTDWTLLDRTYELGPTGGPAMPMFGAGGESVFEQHPCFLRLGSDLPPAKYTIEVTREDEQTGYLLLSTTTPGLSERRELAPEAEPYSVIQPDENRRS